MVFSTVSRIAEQYWIYCNREKRYMLRGEVRNVKNKSMLKAINRGGGQFFIYIYIVVNDYLIL